MKETLLQGRALYKTFAQNNEDTAVPDHIDVEIYAHDFTVIMGPSGAGKSTLLYALSGMDRLTGGEVAYKGETISRFSETQMARLRSREFGFVFQQTHLVSNLTLYENVLVAGYAGKNVRRRKPPAVRPACLTRCTSAVPEAVCPSRFPAGKPSGPRWSVP